MSVTKRELEKLCCNPTEILKQGWLVRCLGCDQETAKHLGLPIDPESLRTEEGGQVAGLGRAAVQKILESHGIVKILAEEGGRTSRGSLGLMRGLCKNMLNGLHEKILRIWMMQWLGGLKK